MLCIFISVLIASLMFYLIADFSKWFFLVNCGLSTINFRIVSIAKNIGTDFVV